MGGMRRRTCYGAFAIIIALFFFATCQNSSSLRGYVAGFFDPIVGNWQLTAVNSGPPSDSLNVSISRNGTYEQTDINGGTTTVTQGSYTMADSTETLTLTPTSETYNGQPWPVGSPASFNVSFFNNLTILQLTDSNNNQYLFQQQ